MLIKIRKTESSLANEISFFFHFQQGNYIQITKCQVELIHIFVQF